MNSLLVVSGASLVWYGILRLRLAHRKLMQMWFAVTMAVLIVPISLFIRAMSVVWLIGVPRSYTAWVSYWLWIAAIKTCYRVNPQIKINVDFAMKDDKTKFTWKDITGLKKKHESVSLLLNHTSFWDIFCFVCVSPVSFLRKTRSLMKASLGNIPIIGFGLANSGHFLVHFKSEEAGNFHVDSEKQEKQNALLQKYVDNGGSLVFFPEGAINKAPDTLLPFRFGSFNTIHQHRLAMFYMVTVGNNKSWPPKAPVGGLPADIRVQIGPIPADFDKESPKELSFKAHDTMQAVLTDMLNNEKKV